MAAWIWILIPLVAIIGGLIVDYQKTKMKVTAQGRQNEHEVDDMRKLVDSLKRRIENLEAIAAGDPGELTTGAGAGMREIEITDEKEENRETVSKLANKNRG